MRPETRALLERELVSLGQSIKSQTEEIWRQEQKLEPTKRILDEMRAKQEAIALDLTEDPDKKDITP